MAVTVVAVEGEEECLESRVRGWLRPMYIRAWADGRAWRDVEGRDEGTRTWGRALGGPKRGDFAGGSGPGASGESLSLSQSHGRAVSISSSPRGRRRVPDLPAVQPRALPASRCVTRLDDHWTTAMALTEFSIGLRVCW